MATEEVRIPDIGDAGEVEVIELCVAAGDEVAVDDALVVIESDKASMEVPSTVAGTVSSVAVAEGDSCSEGDVIAVIETASEGAGETGTDSDGESEAPVAASDEKRSADDASTNAKGDAEGGDEEAQASDDEGERDSESDRDSDRESRGDDAGEETVVDVRVPDIGEAGDVEVIEILVAAGDVVALDDGLVVLESDKATMEVPATAAGEVVSIESKEGDAVSEGTLVARIRARGDASGEKGKTSEAPAPRSSKDAEAADDGKAEERPARESRERSEAADEPGEQRTPTPAPASAKAGGEAGELVYAGPAVRKLARELGVELARVEGSGDKGRILKEDVHAFVKRSLAGDGAAAASPATGGAGIPPIPEVDFSKFGEIEQVPLSRTLKTGAANLHRSWLNLPHVTQFDDADVTELEAFRRSLKPEAERADVKLTPLPFLMKVAAAALREFPRVGGSFAGDGDHYVLKRYCHVGFAVDTPEGLLVPVVRDVDRKGVFDLAREIAELSERARTRKLRPDDMRGGCFSISSLGAIGGRGFTPIVNAPEVAILGVSRLAKQPVWDGSTFVPRDLLPLCLSYDHRAINGAEAGRFLTWYAQALGDVRRLLL